MKMKKWLFLACIFSIVLIPGKARADVSLIVLEAIGVAGEYTGSGHTAVYLSNICADGPVSLRLCRAGEQGVVLSSYPSFGEGVPYEWMAVPVLPYLYGVENERDIPLYANGDVRIFLREEYRRRHLSTFLRDNGGVTMPEGRWQTMLTSVFNRDVYSFNIRTSIDEDKKFLDEFNSLPNVNKFNSFSRNCADFTRKLINRYFPGAAKRDVINDFGITTPKAVARSFTRYIRVRPERLMHITRHTQVAGPIWRSSDNRNFTEMAFKSKKYLIPSLIFDPRVLVVSSALYFLTGRYNLYETYREHATAEIAGLKLEKHFLSDVRRDQRERGKTAREIEDRMERQRLKLLGDSETWDAYKKAFAPVLWNAVEQGLFRDTDEIKTFFRDLELQSDPAFDPDGGLILKVKYYGEDRTLGITRRNIVSPGSDRELAYKLMVAKIYAELNASAKNRGTLEVFKADWKLMRQLFADPPFSLPMAARNRGRFLEKVPPTSLKRKMEKLVIAITH